MTVPKGSIEAADMLRLAVAAVLEADKEFRANMPPEWEGDPLSDEIDGLRRVFSSTLPIAGEGKAPGRSQICDDVFEWLEVEVSAIDTWYRGTPSYQHDAYWMKDEVLKLINDAREAFPAPSSPGKEGGQEVEAVAWRRERDGWLNEQGLGVPLYTRPPHQTTVAAELAEPVARAIWNVRREEEDRCDMDLEDMGEDHSVWVEARAVLSAIAATQPASTALVERLNLYEEILRVVCHHLELPQSESGPADDLRLYDRALEAADEYTKRADADLVTNKSARFAAEAALWKIAAEQNVYLGHGDYETVPALTAEEAQTVARSALSSSSTSREGESRG